jgi:hypothetical protein
LEIVFCVRRSIVGRPPDSSRRKCWIFGCMRWIPL